MFGYVAVLLLMVLTISMLFTNGFGSNTRDRRSTYTQLNASEPTPVPAASPIPSC